MTDRVFRTLLRIKHYKLTWLGGEQHIDWDGEFRKTMREIMPGFYETVEREYPWLIRRVT